MRSTEQRCRWAVAVSRRRSCPLLLDHFADVFHGFADLPLGVTERILRLPRVLVCHALVMQVGIIGEIACGLFDLALECFRLTFEFVSVHAASSCRNHW